MCIGCPDYVTSCWVCRKPVRGNPERTTPQSFFLMDTLCEHYLERYKTDDANLYDHVWLEHSWEDTEGKIFWSMECADNCIFEQWWPESVVEPVVIAFNEYGPEY